MYGRRKSGRLKAVLSVVVALTLLAVAPGPAAARTRRARASARGHAGRTRAQAPRYRAALLEDADTGKVLYDFNADMEWPPASMAKMMLLLLAEEEIERGRCSYKDLVRISERSALTGGSRIGLREGEVYPLGELIKAALIRSANDAAVAVAEKIAGSTEACVRMMNQRAQILEMTHTRYNTVDGLPPRPAHDADITNAHDLATLGRELIKHSDLLRWSGTEQALFDDGAAVLRNTNHLVGRFEGCDGLKTGFTSQSGFNLTATAKRGDMRLIAVVLGAPSNPERFRQAGRLMQWGFDNFTRVAVVRRGQALPVRVQVESGPLIQPIAASEVKVVLPKSELGDIRLEYSVPPTVSAPVPTGSPLGEVIVRDGGRVLTRVSAVCPITVGDISAINRSSAAQDGENSYESGAAPVQSDPQGTQ